MNKYLIKILFPFEKEEIYYTKEKLIVGKKYNIYQTLI